MPDCQTCPAADVCRKAQLWNLANTEDSFLAGFPWDELETSMRFLARLRGTRAKAAEIAVVMPTQRMFEEAADADSEAGPN